MATEVTKKTTDNRNNAGASRRGFGGRGGRPSRGGADRRESDLAHKILAIRRVTRVVRGGRRFSFSIVLVAGDRRGRIGLGVGKASDIALAIEKALNGARKDLTSLSLNKNQTLPHEVRAKFGSALIEIRPSPGRGLVAGSSVRAVLDLAGIRDVSAKIYSRSKNQLNNVRAALNALRSIKV